MDHRPHPDHSEFDDLDDEQTQNRLAPGRLQSQLPHGRARPVSSVPPPVLRAPTAVSLPVRDGLRTIDLPLNQTYEGLESLAQETSASPLPDDDSASELSVVFRGAHHSERPPPDPLPPMRLVPSGGLGANSRRPRPPGPDFVEPEGYRLPQPPRLPGELTPPAATQADYDDDVDTTVMSPKSSSDDSIRPFEVRTVTVPPRIRAAAAPPPLPPARSRVLAIAAGGVAALAVLAALILLLRPERGDLVIDVADQQCGAVDTVQIFVDDELVCTSSPCTLRVSSGTHVVRARAEGYALTAPEAVLVDANVPTLHRIQFGSSSSTGIEVRTNASGYTLYLDGKLVGELPQRVTGLSAGQHTLLISGGEAHYAEERRVDLVADQIMVIEDVVLKPRTGTLRIASNPQLSGAKVSLDGKRIELPYEGQLDASRRYQLRAQKAGFEDFETWVEFDGSSRDRDLNIQLIPTTSGDPSTNEARAERSAPREAPRADVAPREASGARAARARDVESAAKATGKARLTLTSDPPSAVLLDGMPIGQTPKTVTVDPGAHSVLFIHPTMGKARATADLAAGQAKTLRARF